MNFLTTESYDDKEIRNNRWRELRDLYHDVVRWSTSLPNGKMQYLVAWPRVELTTV